MTSPAIIEVKGLTVRFRSPGGIVQVVDNATFEVLRGETLAIVGESGSGKSSTALALMRLLESPPAIVSADAVSFGGTDLLSLDEGKWRAIAGNRIAMVYQDALAALNPVMTVGAQIGEVFRVHRGLSRAASWQRAVELIGKVGIPDAARRAKDYPHQFSGGMRQRVMIAMAIALQPDLLIADEPTTALDVTIQGQIMDLLATLSRDSGMAMMLVTHDLGVVADVADRLIIMYAGRILETGPVDVVTTAPAHPYTMALLEAMPQRQSKGTLLRTIPGAPPNLASVPAGCVFHPRCPRASEVCRKISPANVDLGSGHYAACHHIASALQSREQSYAQ